jgi:polysaccharide chain length determinant protein (PEP-CTERM system associated)
LNPVIAEVLDYARGMWRRRFAGLATAWVVGIAGLATVMVVPDKYEASARVYVDTQSVLKPLMSGLAVQPNVDLQIAMISRTLITRPNMEKLVRMADLDLEAKTPEQRDALIEKIMKSIQLGGSPADNLYVINYRDTNTDRAKRVVDSLLSIFVESGLGDKRRDTQKAQQFIDQQIQEYERRLQESERRLKEFKLKNLGSFGGGDDALAAMQILEGQASTARIELRAAIQSRDALKRELAGEDPVFLPDPADEASPQKDDGATSVPELDARIETLKKNLDELLRTFTDQHPDVIGTRRVLHDLEKERDKQVDAKKAALAAKAASRQADPKRNTSSMNRNPVYQQLKLSLAESEANAAALKGKVEEIESKLAQVRNTARLKPELEEELVQLNRDYAVQKSNYDNLVSRRESALMTSQLEQSSSVADFRIIDPPRVSNKPVAPNRLLLLGAAFVVAIAAGVFASLVFSQLFPVFHSVRGLRRATQRPVLGTVSLQDVTFIRKRKRIATYAFFGGIAALVTAFGSALAVLLLLMRAA